jgi:membrane protein DedA with SNARE-associated domain
LDPLVHELRPAKHGCEALAGLVPFGCTLMTAYLLLTISAFAAQALLFVPIVPLLLATGALAAQGRLHPGGALAALVLGVEFGDLFWYALGP